MHELGVVFHVIDTVKALAVENGAAHINSVTLEVGTVSGVIPDYLTDCWNWAVTKQELMTGCTLKIEPIEAVTHCDGCGRDYDTLAHGKTCPHCGSGETWLRKGNEFSIKEMEVV